MNYNLLVSPYLPTPKIIVLTLMGKVVVKLDVADAFDRKHFVGFHVFVTRCDVVGTWSSDYPTHFSR
jgi:hypothetical protein